MIIFEQTQPLVKYAGPALQGLGVGRVLGHFHERGGRPLARHRRRPRTRHRLLACDVPVRRLGRRGGGLLEHEEPASARLDVDDRGALVERVRLDGRLEALDLWRDRRGDGEMAGGTMLGGKVVGGKMVGGKVLGGIMAWQVAGCSPLSTCGART